MARSAATTPQPLAALDVDAALARKADADAAVDAIRDRLVAGETISPAEYGEVVARAQLASIELEAAEQRVIKRKAADNAAAIAEAEAQLSADKLGQMIDEIQARNTAALEAMDALRRAAATYVDHANSVTNRLRLLRRLGPGDAVDVNGDGIGRGVSGTLADELVADVCRHSLPRRAAQRLDTRFGYPGTAGTLTTFARIIRRGEVDDETNDNE